MGRVEQKIEREWIFPRDRKSSLRENGVEEGTGDPEKSIGETSAKSLTASGCGARILQKHRIFLSTNDLEAKGKDSIPPAPGILPHIDLLRNADLYKSSPNFPSRMGLLVHLDTILVKARSTC